MEVGIEKCAALIMKGGNKQTIERIELHPQESIKIVGEKENYK